MPEWPVFKPRDHDDIHRRNSDQPIACETSPKPSPNRAKTRAKQSLEHSQEHLKLYRTQPLDASGEMFFKVSRFQRSKRYYAELRGSTIVVFRYNATFNTIGTAQHFKIQDVVTVLPVHKYSVEIVQKDDGAPRIYLQPLRTSDAILIYIRVTRGGEGLYAWRHSLGRVLNAPLPTLSNLRIESVIGRGGGGKVFMVTWTHNNEVYALKVIDKVTTFKSAKAFRHVASERMLMEKAGQHPFLLPMKFAFQTERNLFIGTPFCRGGDLASYIRHKGRRTVPYDGADYVSAQVGGQKAKVYGRLTELQVRRIASEIILGLEHLHNRGIVYRDLKPENIFIDAKGFLKIGDYGLAKQLAESASQSGRLKTSSICGTRNYLPPEMLGGKVYSFEADLWSLGVMLYRMLVGAFPFDSGRTKDVFQKIRMDRLHVPTWVSVEARQVLYGLLQKDPKRRLTIAGLKKLEFFDAVDWDMVLSQKSEASIPDIYTGGGVLDALENFELSKLQGITLGEYVCGVNEGGGEEEGGDERDDMAEHRRDPKSMMIGFEYTSGGEGKGNGRGGGPLIVKMQSGGLFSKLASNDVIDRLPISPRKNFPGGKF